MRRIVLLCALTWLTTEIGYWFVRPEYGVALIYPVTGVAMLWFWTTTRRTWWLDSALLLLVIVLTLLHAGAEPGAATMGGLQAVTQAGVTAALMRRLTPGLWGCGGDRPIRTLAQLGSFLVAVIVGAAVSTMLRAAGLGLVEFSSSLEIALVGMRNLCWLYLVAAATLQLAPLVAEGWRSSDVRAANHRWWAGWGTRGRETVLVLFSSVVLHVVVFAPRETPPVTFVMMLPTLWAALRLTPPVATMHAFASAVVSIAMTLAGNGFFAATTDPRVGALLVQALAASVMTIALTVSLVTSERVEATRQARRSERDVAERAGLLSAVLEQIREGIIVVGEDGSVLLRNSALTLFPGSEINPAVGKQLVTPSVYDTTGEPIIPDSLPHARALAGEEVVDEQIVVHDPQGEPRVLEISASRLQHAGDQPRALVTVRDVTAVREREDALAAFAGVVAHDLNNPLTIVSGWADALADGFGDGDLDNATGSRMIARIQDASQQMRRFIDDLLAYTVARDQPLNQRDLDLSAMVEDVAAMRRSGPRRPRVTVQAGLRVHADAVLVRQLLDNLIGNAVKYVAPDRRPDVVVSGRASGARVEISVTDNGVGVPASDRERIFDTFARAHGPEFGGTGLGLGICRKVVRRHGGDIRVEDGPGGHGSTFVFNLPGPRSEEEPAPATSRAETAETADTVETA